MAGVTASVYGEVDFVVLKISFSVNLSVTADLTIESYRQTILRLQIRAAVRAFIKILFIKINFSFDFEWNPVFTLGRIPWLHGRRRSGRLKGRIGSMFWTFRESGCLISRERLRLC